MIKENIYTLFLGFQNRFELSQFSEAKKFAQSTNLAGAFNLLGKNYRDSWYVSKSEIKDNEN